MVKRQSMLEDHVGIKPASKLKDLSRDAVYRVTHPEEVYKMEERKRKLRKKRF